MSAKLPQDAGETEPVHVVPVGPVATGSLLWRWRGQLRVTVIVKATFAFAPDEAMTVIAPAAVRRQELHHHNHPGRTVAIASDLGPYLQQADVLLTGHAYAPPGLAVPQMGVRLALAQGNAVAIDKRLEIHGDRTLGADGPSVPRAFEKMPLVYERAFGGMGYRDNPLGVGAGLGAGRAAPMPNIVAAEGSASPPPAGFGPISEAWPLRKALLGSVDRKALRQRLVELPDAFDFGYFQAAPEDQRIAYLRGDEYLVLEGMSTRFAVLKTRLPGAAAVARVYTPSGATIPVELRGDRLAIDVDQERCTVTWRGRFALTHEGALEQLAVAAGLSLPGRPVVWPAVDVVRAATRASGASEPERASDPGRLERTLTLDEPALPAPIALSATRTLHDEGAPPASMRAPFPVAKPRPAGTTVPIDIAGAPWAGRADAGVVRGPAGAPVMPVGSALDGTLDLGEADASPLDEDVPRSVAWPTAGSPPDDPDGEPGAR
jgi:hypothetical protein